MYVPHLSACGHSVTHASQKYKKATIFFSKDSTGIATIILAMDKLDAGLSGNAKRNVHPAIKAAMQYAKNKLNKYYSLTDLSPCYRIAMGALLYICNINLTMVYSAPPWIKT